jgi:hypothetical protein
MRTTIDLQDELLIAIKKRAAEQRRPLRALIEEAVRAQLARATRRKPRRLRWLTAPGGLPPGVDLADRAAMHEWLRAQR